MKRALSVLFFSILVSEATALEVKLLGGAALSSYSICPMRVELGWFDGYYRYDSSYRPAFTIGVGVEWPLARKIALEVDALYFRKGSRVTETSLDRTLSKTDYVLNVISLPVLVKFKALPDSSPYLVYGGELSYTLSHRYTTTVYPDPSYGIGPQEYSSVDFKDSTRAFSLGVVIGAGIELKIRKVSVLLEARYHLGQVNILSQDRSDYGIFDSIRPNSQVILGALKF